MLNKKRSKAGAFVIVFILLFVTMFSVNIPVANAATFNVTSYGATPNDGNDDTSGIQAAINAANSGDTVYFPNGTYRVSSAINAKSNVKLEGQSQAGVVLQFTGGSLTDSIINISGKTYVEITKLTLDGNDTNKLKNCIFGYNSNHLLIHFVTIKDVYYPDYFGPFGILFTGDNPSSANGVVDSEISDCTITNIGVDADYGCAMRFGWGSSRNSVLRNTISETGRGGVFAGNGSTDLIVKDNSITGSGRKTCGLSIEVHTDCDRAIIENNSVDHWISVSFADYCAVRRNTVSDSSGVYALCGIEAIGSNCIYTNNYVDGGQQLGLSLSNAAFEYSYFGYNSFSDNIQWGVQIQGPETGTTRCLYFYKTDFLYTDKDNPLAYYPDSDGHGIRLLKNVDYVTFDTCKSEYNDSLGVETGSSAAYPVDHLYFVNSSISYNLGNAFSSYSEPYNNFQLQSCTVTGNASNNTPTQKNFTNLLPVAVISSPDKGVIGQTINFTSSSYDSDGSISHVLWDFGDGAPVSTTNASHTYAKTGRYRVTLIVWDNYGRGSRVEKFVDIWAQSNYGGATGSISESSGTYTVNSNGLNFWGTSDDGTFFHLERSSANLTVTAKLQSIQNTNANAAVGIMLREADTANSRHYNVRVIPGGALRILYRTDTGGTSEYETGPGLSFPMEVKIQKTGNSYSAYYKSGANWVQMGTTKTISMGNNVRAGMNIQSVANPRQTAAGVLSDVTIN